MPAASLECLDGTLVTVLNKGFYLRSGAGDAIDGQLLTAAEAMTVPGGPALFLRSDAQQPERMRAYLDRLDPSVRAELTLVVLDPETGLATDLDRLRAAAATYDLPVHAPLGLPAHPAVVEVDASGGTVGEKVAGLVLPATAVAQRTALDAALRTAATGETPPAQGMDRLSGWLKDAAAARQSLGLPPAGPEDAHLSSETDTTRYALGVHIVRYGARDGVNQYDDVLHSTRPVGAADVSAAFGGEPVPVRPEPLARYLAAHPGSAALVFGRGQLLWLMSDTDGTLSWADARAADGARQPFSPDGAADWRTAVLENDARALVFDATGAPVTTPSLVNHAPPQITPIVPPTGTRAEDGTVLIGPWADQKLSGSGLAALGGAGLPIVAVDVRWVAVKDASGRTVWLVDPAQTNALTHAVQRYHLTGVRPIVVMTERQPEIAAVVRQYGGILVQPPTGKLAGVVWEIEDTASVRPATSGVTLTADALTGLDVRLPQPYRYPEVLIDLVSEPTWADAGQYYREHRAALNDPAVADALRHLRSVAGPDPRLAALQTVLDLGPHPSYRVGNDPIEPTVRNSLDPEKPLPEGRVIDPEFLFDYLAGRELLPLAESSTVPGRNQSRIVWDGLLLRAMLGGRLDKHAGAVLAAGVGESDAERAARRPGAREVSRAHASVFRSLADLFTLAERGELGPAGDPAERAKWLGSLQIIDCFTGEDRVPWVLRFRDVITPLLAAQPHLAEKLGGHFEALKAEITICH